MSQCIVPEWKNLRLHKQEQVEAGGEGNRSSQLHTDKQHSHSSTHHLVPMTNYEVAELRWENGQLGMHGHGGLLPIKPAPWCRATDTLESIVHQATYPKQIQMQQHHHHHHAPANISSVDASSGGKLTQIMKKRSRSERNDLGRSGKMQEEQGVEDRSACGSGSASATFCREAADATMMTWPNSFESGRSLKTKSTDDDSACHGGSENQDEEQETKGETGRSHSMRRSRAAAIHNQSERRRRDRINQKMKALQKLVPNASKTDKASMLDEVIEYLKQLQAQIQMMSVRSSMPQMMMPLGMQQHLHMSALLARMGMGVGLGMGMGMIDMTSVAARAASHQPFPQILHPASVAAAAPTFVPPPFVVPSMIPTQAPPQAKPEPGNNAAISLNDPYCAFLAQSMNMELFNKMAELYRQQLSQTAQGSSTPISQPNNEHAD